VSCVDDTISDSFLRPPKSFLARARGRDLCDGVDTTNINHLTMVDGDLPGALIIEEAKVVTKGELRTL